MFILKLAVFSDSTQIIDPLLGYLRVTVTTVVVFTDPYTLLASTVYVPLSVTSALLDRMALGTQC